VSFKTPRTRCAKPSFQRFFMVVEIVKIQKQRKNHKKEKLKLMKAKKCNVKSRRITPTQQR
jgi:hypothetical protein